MKSTNTASIEVAKILFRIGAVLFRTRQPFRYSSGVLSPVYTDNRLIISHPKERKIITGLLSEQVKKLGKVDVLAGTATAGIPHAAMIAQKLNLPMVYVRSEAKSHGKKNQIEGKITRGQKAVVIEDLISTGGSSLAVVFALRKAGVKVTDIVAIFTYGFKEAQTNFKKNKVKLHVLTDINYSAAAALKEGYLKPQQVDSIRDWSKDPKGWGKKMGFE
ncbi:orotate phosphoribosyltransferase [Candidatus Curtissbacteria bacterium]|nr:orotate phosphoribosyltransferase [Candidatus Curtissbacteria bacterium]MBI2599228.1 orotate phosphoribosyltransferase [Candidatus Curtissbacteria bacterium]